MIKNKKYILLMVCMVILVFCGIKYFYNLNIKNFLSGQNELTKKTKTGEFSISEIPLLSTEIVEKRYDDVKFDYNQMDIHKRFANSGMDCTGSLKKYGLSTCNGTGYKTKYKVPQRNLYFEQYGYLLVSGFENDFRVLFKDRPISFFISGDSVYYIDRPMAESGNALVWGDYREPTPMPLQRQEYAKNKARKEIQYLQLSDTREQIIKDLENEETNYIHRYVPKAPPITLKQDEYLFEVLDQIGIDYKNNGVECFYGLQWMLCFRDGYKFYYQIRIPMKDAPERTVSPLKNVKIFE